MIKNKTKSIKAQELSNIIYEYYTDDTHRVNDIDAGSLTEVSENVTSEVSVSPNPFVEGVSKYNVTVANKGNYSLSVYDAVGNKVAQLFNGSLEAGTTSDQVWNALDANGNKLNSGVYFLKLEGNNVNNVQKVVISR